MAKEKQTKSQLLKATAYAVYKDARNAAVAARDVTYEAADVAFDDATDVADAAYMKGNDDE